MKLKILITLLIVITCALVTFAQKDTIPNSKYYPPKTDGKNVAIMLLGGSEGGFPSYYDTEYLTKLGYPCYIIGYFGTKNTPDYLEMIPLEYFEEIIKKFKSKPEVKNKKIVVWGGSKGGELALLLASKFKQIEGVIATVPGSVVFQGLGPGYKSSWSYNGEGLPFVPFAEYDYSKIVNNQYVEPYRLALKQTEAVEKAVIKVENINGPILLLAGKEDMMWPSAQMCDMIMKRLDENKFPYWHKLFAYENAGHSLNEAYMIGGTVEGNKQARIDSGPRIYDFLDQLSK
jgi:esterase/lipase